MGREDTSTADKYRQREKWVVSESRQGDIFSGVAKHKTPEAANQEATKTTDSELEKWQAHKNRSLLLNDGVGRPVCQS